MVNEYVKILAPIAAFLLVISLVIYFSVKENYVASSYTQVHFDDPISQDIPHKNAGFVNYSVKPLTYSEASKTGSEQPITNWGLLNSTVNPASRSVSYSTPYTSSQLVSIDNSGNKYVEVKSGKGGEKNAFLGTLDYE